MMEVVLYPQDLEEACSGKERTTLLITLALSPNLFSLSLFSIKKQAHHSRLELHGESVESYQS